MVVPHVFDKGALELDPDHYWIDGEKGDVDASTRTIKLESWSDTNWGELKLSGTVEITEEIVNKVISQKEKKELGDGEPKPTRLVVAVDCPDTHHRTHAEVSARPPHGPGTYEWEIELPRTVAYGQIELTPYLVRTGNFDRNRSGRFASYTGQKLADGKRWKVQLDGTSDTEDDIMDVKFKRFEKDPSVPDDNVYDLSLTGPGEPQVWVNGDHKLIKSVVTSGGTTGFRPRLQKVLAKWIAKNVTKDLLIAAVSGTRVEGDEQYWEEEWQRVLLEDYGPEIVDVDTPEAIANEVNRRFEQDTDMFPELMNKIERHLQDELELHEPLTKFVQNEGPDHMQTMEEAE